MSLSSRKGASSLRARRRRSRRIRRWSRPISAMAPRQNGGHHMQRETQLDVRDLHAGYGETEVLRGVDLTIASGEIVAVLGSNGVGKSTLNRALSGVVRARTGEIKFEGHDVAHERPQAIVARGLVHVPEGRRVFPNLSVRENLDLGSYRRGAASRAQNRERVFTIFPRLRERGTQRAGTLSGG